MDSKTRCEWVPPGNTIYEEYHDKEWGVPVHDDRLLFEFLVLEGAQAGLSWITILKRRDNYRKAFDFFDPEKVARYDDKKIAELLQDSGIIRNKLKVNSAVTNAQAFLKVREEFGSFDTYMWRFMEDGKPLVNRFKSLKELPAKTPLSDTISKDLKQRGFKFVGSIIVYSHMQATGMVNDHIVDCFRHKEV
ncbi:MAG: DNA-3-methyladenine glycosylase I [bacterium]|nr:DNA-3-methyladenine glycosylase I [bacterium]